MSEWIDVKKELPPCDALYQVCDRTDICSPSDAWYDGENFRIIDDTDCKKNFWRHIPVKIKRYGKVKDE